MYMIKSIAQSVSNVEFFLPKALFFCADERISLAKQHGGSGSDFLVPEHEQKKHIKHPLTLPF